MDDHEPRRPTGRLVLPALVVAVGAAVVGIDRRSLWLDESFSLAATNQMGEAVTGTGGNMAGYYLLLDLWTTVSTSVWWIRLLSVLLMAAAIVPLGSLARRMGGDVLAVRATIAFALAAQTTRYAQEARAYALVALIVAASWWVFAEAATEEGSDRRRLLRRVLVALAVASVLAHGLAVLSLFAIGVAAALSPQRRRAVGVAAPAIVAAVATVAVLVGGGADGLASWVPALSVDQVAVAARAYTSPWWWVALPLGALVVLGAVDAVRGDRRDPTERWLAALPVVWVAVPVIGLLALSVVRPVFDHRYLMGILPGVALLLARGTLVVDRRLHGRTVVVGATALAALALLLPGQVEVHRDDGDDWRGAATLVAGEGRPGDGLVFPERFHRPPFEAAWREVPAGTAAPELVGFDRPLGTVRRHDESRPPEAVAESIAEVDRLWVVLGTEPGVDTRRLDELLASEAIDGRFRVVDDVRPGGVVRVLLLVAR